MKLTDVVMIMIVSVALVQMDYVNLIVKMKRRVFLIIRIPNILFVVIRQIQLMVYVVSIRFQTANVVMKI